MYSPEIKLQIDEVLSELLFDMISSGPGDGEKRGEKVDVKRKNERERRNGEKEYCMLGGREK